MAVLLSTGCRHTPVGFYRLEKFQDELVIIPPPYWDHAENTKVTLRLALPAQVKPRRLGDCTIESGLFRLTSREGSSAQWVGALPSLRNWRQSITDGSFHEQWERLRERMGGLEESGCLSTKAGGRLTEAARESVPALLGETMLYRYDYDPGRGFVNLDPGMRLKIERAEFGPSGKFQDTSTAYYQINRDSQGAIRFQLDKAGPPRTAGANLPDRTLADRTNGMAHARLFFLGKRVPQNVDYAAMVIRTQSAAHMELITQAIRMRPETGCPTPANRESDCVLFQGAVTVSGELQVMFNKRPVFVGLSQTLRQLLAQLKQPGCGTNIQRLRILREYLNNPTPIDFAAVGNAVLGLVLVGNDRIFCSP